MRGLSRDLSARTWPEKTVCGPKLSDGVGEGEGGVSDRGDVAEGAYG